MRNLQAGSSLKIEELELLGLSLSGIRTSLALPQYGIAFDVAQGLPFTVKQKKFFITHGHMDHAAGIPYIISQKALLNEPSPIFYMPKSLVEPMENIMSQWQKIEGFPYKYEFIGVDETSLIELNERAYLRPFKTIHRIDSQGYGLFQKNKKLRPEFSGLSEKEIQNLRHQGTEISQEMHHCLLSFTGDTQIEFVQQSPWATAAKILVMECTYLDEKRDIAHAKKWGHTHLQELIPLLDEIKAEKIVLIHFSSRYSLSEAEKIIKAAVPKKHLDRIVLFPGQ